MEFKAWRHGLRLTGVEALRIDFDDVSIEVHRYAPAGHLVCMLPGLGGGIKRFAKLASRLADAGYQPVAMNPRGAGESVGPLENLRMTTLANDVAEVIGRLGGPATVIGNGFGNRVARYLGSHRPEVVASLVLVGAGGEVPADPEAAAAMQSFLDRSLPDADRFDAARRAFFAPGHDLAPDFIDRGQTSEAIGSQLAAMRAEEDDAWLAGGSARILVVQGADDRIAPPENGYRLRARWPERVEVVDIPRAAHAVLLEQPDTVAEAIIGFLAASR